MPNIANLKTWKTAQNLAKPKDVAIPQNVRLSLLERVQSSLDLEDTLKSALKALNFLVKTDGALFQSEERGINLSVGQPKRCRVTYNLSLPTENLGSLTFSRGKKYNENELNEIEGFIGLILSPLRNALLYRDALENALRDGLTQLGNRKALDETLIRELALAKRNGHETSIILADLDHFKSINDRYGHQAGDEAILHAVACFKEFTRNTDHIFRFGGEEFLFILPDTSNACAMHVAERIRQGLGEKTFSYGDTAIEVTTSLGVATHNLEDEQETLIRRADAALYSAKQNGRNRSENAETAVC